MNAGRFMCVAMLFLSSAGLVRASDSHLSSAEVSSLADTAASRAGYDIKRFSAVPPLFDPVSQSWSRHYSKWSESGAKVFTVFVYDKSSRTEVSCIGMRSALGAKPIDEAEIPAEIKPFIPSGMTAVQFDCVDLNGDGRADYLLVLHAEPLHQLMILVRQPDGTLSLQGTNKDVIWDEYGVGVNGGYSVSSRRNGLTVDNWSGTGGLGEEDRYDFSYSPKQKTWVLLRIVKTVQTGEPEDATAKPVISTKKDFGLVKFSDFVRGVE
jgi:hypothetical protein